MCSTWMQPGVNTSEVGYSTVQVWLVSRRGGCLEEGAFQIMGIPRPMLRDEYPISTPTFTRRCDTHPSPRYQPPPHPSGIPIPFCNTHHINLHLVVITGDQFKIIDRETQTSSNNDKHYFSDEQSENSHHSS